MIKRFELENFTAFDKLGIDFSPRVNLIIGENSTGKTHLLKAAYGICSTGLISEESPELKPAEVNRHLTTKFQSLFLPNRNSPAQMHRNGAKERARLQICFAGDYEISVEFSRKSKLLKVRETIPFERYKAQAIFIPTKEVISFMKGFSSLYEKYEISFNQTYQDLCFLLDLPAVRSEMLQEKVKWAIDEIEKTCGGRFVFLGGGRVVFETENIEYPANFIAEGFRKIGILSRLLETGAIQPGVSGPLFWDEPESNLNPQIAEILVRILLELSRNGQQVIIATHDYVLLKWFDLLSETGKGDHVRYHSLYRDAPTGEIKLSSTDDYLEISPNSIDEAFGYLVDKEIEKDMGNLGK